jgi:arsenate reductase
VFRAAVKGSPEEIEKTFRDAFMILDRRIALFLSLPLARPHNSQLRRTLMTKGTGEIGAEQAFRC